MPVHQFVNDFTLRDKGLSNYWGYNTIGFLAPHNGYAAYGTRGEQVAEFKGMVKALHEAGIEVILDVVYNHTAEGNQLGPTICFRGIDNAAYYRLVDDDKAHYYDTTGTGNSLLMRHPHVLQLIMDSLRYWVTEMHVDGFRFDLAATLARQFHEVDKLSAFFDLVQQDPVVSQVKLIAEPWDVGDGGYQVGNFPPLWTEWNGKYRDTVRDFWRGEQRDARRVRLAPHRLQRPLRAQRPQADRLDQLRHRPRRLHAAGPGVLQREAQRRQRRGRQRRREPQPLLELRRRGPDRRTRRSTPCGCASSATCSRPSCSRRACRCSCTVTSSAAPRAATTTATARTTRSRGSTGTSTRTSSTSSPSRSGSSSCAATTRCSAAAGSSPASADHGGESAVGDIAWFEPGGNHMDEDSWANGYARSMMVFLNGQTHPRARHPRSADARRPLPGDLQRPPRRAAVRPAGQGVRRALGHRARHVRAGGRGQGVQARRQGEGARPQRRRAALSARRSRPARPPERPPPADEPRRRQVCRVVQRRTDPGRRAGGARPRPTDCRSSRTSPSATRPSRRTTLRRWGSRTPTCRRSWPPAPGSTHGYDVVEPRVPQRGGRWRGGLRRAGRRRSVRPDSARSSTWCPTT